jgi:hypothetical protein
MRVLRSDPTNERRLVSTEDPNVTLRGFHHRTPEVDIRIDLGFIGDPTRLMTVTAIDVEGGALLAHVVRPWRPRGAYGKAWAEVQRQILVITGEDIGPPPTGGANR